MRKRIKVLKVLASPTTCHQIGDIIVVDGATADSLIKERAASLVEVVNDDPPAIPVRSETPEAAVAEPEVEQAVKVSPKRKRGFML